MASDLIELFYKNRDGEKALPMQSYMKNKFAFLGIPKPKRALLQRDFIKLGKKQELDWDMVCFLWNLPEREFQYCALDYLQVLTGKLQKTDISRVENLITSKSWWDTVDMLASAVVGSLCLKHPDLVKSHIIPWSRSDNLWLVRTALLFQLKYKDKTDALLLEAVILANIDSREFFINKAMGWVLREYSKTDKVWVANFVDKHELNPLSKREASKYL